MARGRAYRSFVLLLFAALVVAAAGEVRASANSSVQEEADALATALYNAEEPEEVEELICRILEIVGVPVLEKTFESVVMDETFGILLEPGIYDEELEFLAKAFVERQMMSLDDVVRGLVGGEVSFGAVSTEDQTGAAVERAMRELRRQAELDPEDWDWFLIRLVDALGRREEYPFSLLGPMDESCREKFREKWGAPHEVKTSQQVATSFLLEDMAGMAEGAEPGDEDTVEMLSMMQENEEAIAAMMQGDMSALIQMAIQAAGGDDDTTEEEMMAAMGMLRGQQGGQSGVGLGESPVTTPLPGADMSHRPGEGPLQEALAIARRERDEVSRLLTSTKRASEQALAEAQRRLQERSSPPDADTLVDLGLQEFGNYVQLEAQEEQLAMFEAEVVELEELEEQVRTEEEGAGEVAENPNVMFYRPQEPSSCLFLDPIQLLLIQIDLFEYVRFCRALELLEGRE